jgi:hypothetical protein
VKRVKRKLKINIWGYIDVGDINLVLDEKTQQLHTNSHIATDIKYRCKDITRDGVLTLEAEYIPEEY